MVHKIIFKETRGNETMKGLGKKELSHTLQCWCIAGEMGGDEVADLPAPFLKRWKQKQKVWGTCPHFHNGKKGRTETVACALCLFPGYLGSQNISKCFKQVPKTLGNCSVRWGSFPYSQHFLSLFRVSGSQVTSSLPAFMGWRKRSHEIMKFLNQE